MNILLSLGIAMLVGTFSTRLMKLIKLPNVTGYLLAGLLIGPSCLKLVSSEATETLGVIVTVALGFIAFSIGGEFKLSHIKAIGGSALVICFFQAIAACMTVFVVLLIAGFPMPVVFVLSAIATATAPAATLMVVRQYKADGPVTRTLLPVVALDDAIGLIIFAVFISVAKSLSSGDTLGLYDMLVSPLIEIVLSLLAGSAIGALLALSVRFFKSRANRLCLMTASVVLGVALAEQFGLSSLLLCMMIGALFTNLRKDAEVITEGCDRFTPPVLMLFFVISGAQLDLSVLPAVGLLGVLYILARSAGKYIGSYTGSLLVHADKNIRRYLGITLLPQAGVAVGMAQLAMVALPSLGPQIRAVVLCATLIYEMVGPVLTKRALISAGEIERGK